MAFALENKSCCFSNLKVKIKNLALAFFRLGTFCIAHVIFLSELLPRAPKVGSACSIYESVSMCVLAYHIKGGLHNYIGAVHIAATGVKILDRPNKS